MYIGLILTIDLFFLFLGVLALYGIYAKAVEMGKKEKDISPEKLTEAVHDAINKADHRKYM